MQARGDGRIQHAAAAEILRVRCCDQQHRAPPQWAGRGKRLSGRLRLVARPDQVVRAVLVLDQAGIDRRRERRVVDGYGQVFPPGLAGLLPRCADFVASRLQVEVGGVLGVALVVGNQLDLDVERQGAKRAGEAVFLCGEGADVSHDVSPFGLNKVAPVRPCCDPAGGGWAGRTAQRSQQRGEPGSEKNLSREECAQRRGNCFRCKVAAIKHKAQPRHRQDSQQDKDAQAARSRMETWPTRHPRVTAAPACALTRARSMPRRQGQSAPAAAHGHILRRGVEAP